MIRSIYIFVFAIIFMSFSPVLSNSSDQLSTNPAQNLKNKKKKIVFIAGKDSHRRGDHEHKAGCHLLARLLNENRSDIQAVVIENGWPADPSVLNDADAIVMYSDGAERHMVLPHLEEMDELVKKGVGLVAIHYATEVPKGKAAEYFSNWFGGYFEPFYSVNPVFIPEFKAYPKHPIANGVKPIHLKDEWYYHLRFSEGKNIIPILNTNPPLSTLLPEETSVRGNNEFVRKDLKDGKLQTVSWALERPDGGRSFGFTAGHYHVNWANDDFRKLMLNAIVWVAKLKVPKKGVTTSTPTSKEMEYLLKEAKP